MADPSTWWGTRSVSRSVRPVRDPDQPVPVSVEHRRATSTCARPSGSSPARPAASPGSTSRPTSARWCTRWPSGSPPASCRSGPDGVEPLMGHVEQVWDRLEFRTPWAKARELDRIRIGAGPVPRLAPRQRPHRGRDRGGLPRGPRPAQRRAGAGSTATPTGSSSTPTAGSWSWTSRPVAPSRPTSRCSPTSSSVSTSSPSTTGPPTSSLDRTARAGGAELVQLGLHRRRRATPPSSTSPSRPTTARSATALRGRLQRAAAAAAHRELPRRRRPALPRLRLRADLPDQERRARWSAPVTVQPLRIDTPADLAAAMGAPVAGQRAAVGRDHRTAGARGRHRRCRVGQDHADGGPRGLPRAHRRRCGPTRCSA